MLLIVLRRCDLPLCLQRACISFTISLALVRVWSMENPEITRRKQRPENIN